MIKIIKFENTEIWGFEHALRGMRNPMESWGKSDSEYSFDGATGKCSYHIGEADLALAQKLVRAGSEHRKFMRQIFVSVDITAPLFWWKHLDTYKIGVTTNSCSTMHKIAAKEFTLEDFSCEFLEDDCLICAVRDSEGDACIWLTPLDVLKYTIVALNRARRRYCETKNKNDWWQMIQLLPNSYNQKRTVTMNYENIFSICSQRKNHKLNEWSGVDDPSMPNFISWARELPYAKELIFIDEKENEGAVSNGVQRID